MSTYKLILTAVTPVHVGSGETYSKKEYFFDERSRKVTLLDMKKIMAWLVAQNKPQYIDAFEAFMFSGRDSDIRGFLRRVGMPQEEIKKAEIYSLDAALADNDETYDLKPFMHDAHGLPFVPGSALKGALRTVILVKMLLDGRARGNIDLRDKKCAEKIECELLHTLRRDRRVENAHNSIMSGFSVSDSLPFSQENLMVAKKIDFNKYKGKEKELPIFRECASRGTEMIFRVSVSPETENIAGAKALREAVQAFGDYYARTYEQKFPGQYREALDRCIFLGGGSGCFSKNIVYPRYINDYKKALGLMTRVMENRFPEYDHDIDRGLGISPRTLKCARVEGRTRQMGICRVRIEETE